MTIIKAGVALVLALAFALAGTSAATGTSDCVNVWFDSIGTGIGVRTTFNEVIQIKASTDVPGQGLASTISIVPAACGAAGIPGTRVATPEVDPALSVDTMLLLA